MEKLYSNTTGIFNRNVYLLIILFVPFVLSAEIPPKKKLELLNGIEKSSLKKHVQILASDSLEGRSPGSEGELKAANYIINHFREIGLQQASPRYGYKQPFKMMYNSWDSLYISINGVKYEQYDGILFDRRIQVADTTYPLVFAGDGRKSFVEGVDFKNKAVLLFGKNLRSVFYKEAKLLKEAGAAVILAANPSNSRQYAPYEALSKQRYFYSPRKHLVDPIKLTKEEKYFSTFNFGRDARKTGLPICISNQRVKDITGLSASRLQKRMAKANNFKELNKDFPDLNCRLKTEFVIDTIQAYNVWGEIRSEDEDADWVVICAHYDHLGKERNMVYYGADDNASGVAGMMELAEVFMRLKKEGVSPQKNILFVAFSAEESGLLGSKYMAERLVKDRKISRVVNLDMIGRPKGGASPVLHYIGNYMDEDYLKEANERIKAYGLSFDSKMNNTASKLGASDQYSFIRKGVPSSFFFTGIHEDYHSPRDTWDKLNYKHYTEVVRFITEMCLYEFYGL